VFAQCGMVSQSTGENKMNNDNRIMTAEEESEAAKVPSKQLLNVISKIEKLVAKYKELVQEFRNDQSNDELRDSLVSILIKISEVSKENATAWW
jgi:predicted house-cleaning noncanonical NTP pyrophosphatase (MazG superfamily)